MVKKSEIKTGDKVRFMFIGVEYIGEVFEIDKKQNTIKVKTDRGVTHVIDTTATDSKFCYLK